MYKNRYVMMFAVLALFCTCLSGCFKPDTWDSTESTTGKDPVQTTPTIKTDHTDPTENTTQPTETAPVTPVDIDTYGGAVIVGVNWI